MTVGDPSPELPEIPRDFKFEVPDDIGDCLIDSWHDAMAGLTMGLDRVAGYSNDTWPKALHSFGDTIVLFRLAQLGSGKSAYYVTVNKSELVSTPFADVECLTIDDYVMPTDYLSIGTRRTTASRDPRTLQWTYDSYCGPIIHKRYDKVTQIFGADYTLPATPDFDLATPEQLEPMVVQEQAELAGRLEKLLWGLNGATLDQYISLDQV